jgi:hypothetical protein
VTGLASENIHSQAGILALFELDLISKRTEILFTIAVKKTINFISNSDKK